MIEDYLWEADDGSPTEAALIIKVDEEYLDMVRVDVVDMDDESRETEMFLRLDQLGALDLIAAITEKLIEIGDAEKHVDSIFDTDEW